MVADGDATGTTATGKDVEVLGGAGTRALDAPDAVGEPRSDIARRFIVLLCVCGFFIDFRPSEPYLTPYLIDDKALGERDVNEHVYPIWTYAYLALLLPVGALSQLAGYRACIQIAILVLLLTYALLIWADTLAAMQTTQVTFASYSALHTCVFFTYVYTSCSADVYHRVTGYLRSISLIGHVAADLLGQALVLAGVPRADLFVITFASTIVAFLCFALVPRAEDVRRASRAGAVASAGSVDERGSVKMNGVDGRSDDDARDDGARDDDDSAAPTHHFGWHALRSQLTLANVVATLRRLLAEYADPTVLFFSLYVWTGNGVLELVLNYDTSLFYALDPTMDYNGVVLAVGRLVAALATFVPTLARVHHFLDAHAPLVYTVLPLMGSVMLFASAATTSIEFAYVLFAMFYAVMAFLLSVACARIAAHMSTRTSFSLLFAVNTFVSLVVQTVLQVLIGKDGWRLSIQGKYRLFGTELAMVGVMFGVIWVWQRRAGGRRRRGGRGRGGVANDDDRTQSLLGASASSHFDEL